MGIIERIFDIVDCKNISINKFSKTIGVSNGYLAKQRVSNANVGSHIVEKIVNEYPDIDPEWLLTGHGEMLRRSNIGHNTVGNHSPITGNIEIQNYKADLDVANIRISYLEQIIKDKEEIIKILKKDGNRP